MEQERLGGTRSGATRRRQAQPQWRQVMNLRRRGFGIRQIARIVGYSAGWESKLVKRLFSKQPRVFPEHSFHYKPRPVWAAHPRPVWAAHGSRLLTLAVLYRHYALHAVLQGEHLDDAQERNRRDRQFTLSQARIIGRRGRRPSTGLLGALGKGFLGMALLACRELDGLPIAEADIAVNREFGWRKKSWWR